MQVKQASASIPFTTAVPFNTLITEIAAYTGSLPQTFTIDSNNAKSGYGAFCFYTANGGSNEPDISAFTQLGSESFDNTNGAVNLLVFVKLGTVYGVRVLTSAEAGGGGLTPLSTPTLTATVISDTKIDLSSTTDPNAVSYKFERSPNGTTGWTVIQNTSSNTCSDTGLTAATHYYYRVTLVGDGVTYSNSGYGTNDDTTAAGTDTDAAAYITAEETAASITIDTTNRNAINTLITGLKSNSLWTDITDLMLGYGTGLKNARNLSANATTTDSPTIGATGYSFNGSSNFITALNKDAISFGIYAKNNTADKPLFGTLDAGTGTYFFPTSSGSAAVRIKGAGDQSAANASPAPATYVLSERSTPAIRVTKNDVQIISSGVSVTGASTVPMMLGCFNNAGSPVSYNTCIIGIYIAGTAAWTDGQMTTIYNLINAFITATSRA